MNFKKKVLPIVFCFVIVVIAAVVGIILWGKNSGHRVIKVDKVSGEAGLERDEVWQEIYENINLKSQDAVITGQDGQVELLIDSDKHVLARENTKFKVVSSGNENKGKLKIELLYGTSLVEIENKLPEDAFFEVETPNATIGVRGTVFETSYDEDENKTVVVVTSGVVEVTTDTETVMVEEGQKAIVVDDVAEVGENYTFINDPSIEDINNVTKIIYQTETQKIESGKALTSDEIAVLETVPNSKIIYVAVDGLGQAYGMGVPFQGYFVRLGARPNEGYHYVGCESDTIEFVFDTYDTPGFVVPESGEHIIYVYFAPNE